MELSINNMIKKIIILILKGNGMSEYKQEKEYITNYLEEILYNEDDFFDYETVNMVIIDVENS